MKIKFEFEIEIDIEKELKRLQEGLGDYPEILERQKYILQLLAEEKFKELLEAYKNLPYDEEEECPEQEYTGLWLHELVNKISTTNAKILKNEKDSVQ